MEQRNTPPRQGVLLTLIVIAFAAFVGCNSDTSTDNQTSDLDFESGEFAIFGFDDLSASVSDATLEKDASVDPGVFTGEHFSNGGQFGRRGPRGAFGPHRGFGRKRGNHLFEILIELDLNDAQKDQARDLMDGNRDCVKAVLEEFRGAFEEIMADAKEQRQGVKDSVDSGDLTREEAHERIREINAAMRAAIEDTPEGQAAREGLCACQTSLFEAFQAILNETQQTAFDEWVSGLDEGCFSG